MVAEHAANIFSPKPLERMENIILQDQYQYCSADYCKKMCLPNKEKKNLWNVNKKNPKQNKKTQTQSDKHGKLRGV